MIKAEGADAGGRCQEDGGLGDKGLELRGHRCPPASCDTLQRDLWVPRGHNVAVGVLPRGFGAVAQGWEQQSPLQMG